MGRQRTMLIGYSSIRDSAVALASVARETQPPPPMRGVRRAGGYTPPCLLEYMSPPPVGKIHHILPGVRGSLIPTHQRRINMEYDMGLPADMAP